MIKLDKNNKLLFAGDSITDGGRSRNMDLNHYFGHGYQYIVSSKIAIENIGKNIKFINKGYSGGGINTLYNIWYEEVLSLEPDIISIYIGINDLFKSNTKNAKMNLNRFEGVYDMLLNDTVQYLPNCSIIIVEPIYAIADNPKNYIDYSPHILCDKEFVPLNINETEDEKKFRRKEIAEFQNVTRRLADKYNAIFVPLQQSFDDMLKAVETEYLLWDGVHPTLAGHSIIADNWYRTVEEYCNNKKTK